MFLSCARKCFTCFNSFYPRVNSMRSRYYLLSPFYKWIEAFNWEILSFGLDYFLFLPAGTFDSVLLYLTSPMCFCLCSPDWIISVDLLSNSLIVSCAFSNLILTHLTNFSFWLSNFSTPEFPFRCFLSFYFSAVILYLLNRCHHISLILWI